MQEKSWVERTFGPSWSTTLTGLGGVPMALAVVWVGIIYESKELLGFGVTIFGMAVAALGVLARSNGASEAAHTAQAADHQRNADRIDSLTTHVEQVPSVVAQAVQAQVRPPSPRC